MIENDNAASILIAKLNTECDRIEANNSWEDIDSLSNEGIEIVLSVMDPQNIENRSEKEIGEYVGSRFELLNRIDEYAKTLPEGNRRILFENATSYMQQLMTAD